jgi:hypothetical protein
VRHAAARHVGVQHAQQRRGTQQRLDVVNRQQVIRRFGVARAMARAQLTQRVRVCCRNRQQRLTRDCEAARHVQRLESAAGARRGAAQQRVRHNADAARA